MSKNGGVPLLEVEALEQSYGASKVLHGSSLSIESGEVMVLLGRNGMGKSTLLRTIMGQLPHQAGHIRLQGDLLDNKPPEVRNKLGLTFVPQGHRLFRSLTVAEHLAVAYRPANGGYKPDDVYARFERLAERKQTPGMLLSGGEQQMLAVGRALVGNGKLVLMDEPTEGVDQHTSGVIVAVIEELRREGTSVLLVEQRVDLAMPLADKVRVLRRGHVVFSSDSPCDVRSDPSALYDELGV